MNKTAGDPTKKGLLSWGVEKKSVNIQTDTLIIPGPKYKNLSAGAKLGFPQKGSQRSRSKVNRVKYNFDVPVLQLTVATSAEESRMPVGVSSRVPT